MHPDEGAARRNLPTLVRAFPIGDVLDAHLESVQRVRTGDIVDRHAYHPVDRPPLAHHPTDVTETFHVTPRWHRERRFGRSDRAEVDSGDVDGVLDRLFPRCPPASINVELGHRGESVAVGRLDRARLHLEEPDANVDAGPGPELGHHLGLLGPLL